MYVLETQRNFLIAVLVLLHCSVSGQSIFDRFGIRHYGNSHDEPFYHAENIHQDSLNRLVFKYSSKFRHFDHIMEYDGIRFAKRIPSRRGEFLERDTIHNVTWYKPDLFTATAYRGDSVFASISTDEYFKLNFHRVYQKNDLLFLLTNSGIIEYKWIQDEIIYQRSIPYPSQSGVVDKLEIVGDTLYCNTSEGVIYRLYDSIENLYTVVEQSEGLRFMLPGNRLVRYDRNYDRILASDSWMTKLLITLGKTTRVYLQDSKGRLWVAKRGSTEKGIYLYSKGGIEGEKIDIGISDNAGINDIYEDHEGSIWIGTVGEGLIQIYEKTIQLLDSTIGLKSDNVSSVVQSEDGTIYLSQGCDGVSIIRPDLTIDRIADIGCVKSVISQSNGYLWLNTYGILRFENEEYKRHYLRKDGLHSRTIKSIFEDSQGVLWVGTRQAIHKFEDDRFMPFVDDSIAFFNRVFNIVELKPDSFLLAFLDGEIMTFSNGNFKEVPSETQNVSHLYQDSENRIWVATEGDGLHKYVDGKVISMPNSKLFSNDISFLQEDDYGNIWSISEDNTIRYANKEALWNDMQVRVGKYTVADGLPLIHSDKRMQPSAELLQNGKIIFPNIHGAIVIDPKQSKSKRNEFKSTFIYNDSCYTAYDTISLPVGLNDIFFTFNNVTLHPENHFEYEYSFTANNWKQIVDHSAINITNVPFGHNTLQIRSRYSDEDEWVVSTIDIIAPAPYYYQWWFVLLMSGLLTAGVVFLVKWRTSIVKEQNIYLEEKVAEQTNELMNEKEQLAQSLIQQKKLTQELNLTQASKNRMYAQISHEFKSPLQAINSYLTSNKEHLSSDDKSRIAGNIKQLLNTSSEIMDLSKAETGTLKAKKDYYNINNVIQEQIELKTSLADDKNISIDFEGEEKIYIHCDISLMQKVIGNLLSNAIKFSSKGGVVTVSSKVSGSHQVIIVKDRGVGVPSEEIGNLTLDYFQASNNREEGTGIGLSLVERILQLHDSQLSIQSTLGEGSEFSFKLLRPNLANKEIESRYYDADDIQSQLDSFINPNRDTILAIDDSPDILHFVRRTLHRKFNVVTTTSGILALDYLNKIDPVLILSDVNMPILSGTDLLRKIRKISQYESIPFLLLTGSVSNESELTGIKSGADFVLQKPIEIDLLVSQINQILNRQTKLIVEVKERFAHQLLPVNILDDDKEIIIQMENFILENLENSKLLSEDIANALGIGEKTLRNRVKKITGFTIKEYLKNFRLEKAKLLLEQDYGTKGEVATAVGFSSLSYFSKSYKKYFSS